MNESIAQIKSVVLSLIVITGGQFNDVHGLCFAELCFV